MDRRKVHRPQSAAGLNRRQSNRTRKRTETPSAKPPPRFRSFIEASFRWAILIGLLILLAGSLTARRAAIRDAARLESELAELEREKAELGEELNRFSDPDWRESYWKWRTMRHEAGEYYIDFIEPGTL